MLSAKTWKKFKLFSTLGGMLYLIHTRYSPWKVQCGILDLKENHVKRFRQYVPWLSNAFPKPSNAGRKPGQHQRIRSGQSEPDTVID